MNLPACLKVSRRAVLRLNKPSGLAHTRPKWDWLSNDMKSPG